MTLSRPHNCSRLDREYQGTTQLAQGKPQLNLFLVVLHKFDHITNKNRTFDVSRNRRAGVFSSLKARHRISLVRSGWAIDDRQHADSFRAERVVRAKD